MKPMAFKTTNSNLEEVRGVYFELKRPTKSGKSHSSTAVKGRKVLLPYSICEEGFATLQTIQAT